MREYLMGVAITLWLGYVYIYKVLKDSERASYALRTLFIMGLFSWLGTVITLFNILIYFKRKK